MAKLFFYFCILFVALNLAYALEARCNHDFDAGLCYGENTRYGFNVKSGACEEFSYGGCGGNDNNFETLEECKSVCGN